MGLTCIRPGNQWEAGKIDWNPCSLGECVKKETLFPQMQKTWAELIER